MSELRKHIAQSRISTTISADRVKIENREVPGDAFVWDFYLTPLEARKFARELMSRAEEIDPVGPLDEYRGQ